MVDCANLNLHLKSRLGLEQEEADATTLDRLLLTVRVMVACQLLIANCRRALAEVDEQALNSLPLSQPQLRRLIAQESTPIV